MQNTKVVVKKDPTGYLKNSTEINVFGALALDDMGFSETVVHKTIGGPLSKKSDTFRPLESNNPTYLFPRRVIGLFVLGNTSDSLVVTRWDHTHPV